MKDAFGQELETHQGICGTCGSRATANAENESYSSCCNDRIEYGEEAAETVREEIAYRAELNR